MKAAALLLALLVSTVQTVGWVECCCILICKHHNKPCGDCKKDEPAAGTHDCCTKEATGHAPTPSPGREKRCSHIEPSSEVLSQVADVPPLTLDLLLVLPELTLPQDPGDLRSPEAPTCDTRGSPLLHLLYSVLLI